MDITYLREAFDYNPETGDIRWGKRPKEHFPTTKGYNLWCTRFAGKVPGGITKKGYRRIPIGRATFYAHRLIWMIHYGEDPAGQIDHINGDRADNRIGNLRVTDNTGNARNRKVRANNTSGYSGVKWWPDRQKWQAQIGVGRSSAKSLGFYETKDEAIAARRGAEIVLEYHPNHGRPAAS